MASSLKTSWIVPLSGPPKVWLQHALDKDNTLCPLSAMFPRLIIISISISIPISLFFFVHFWRIAY